jgi:hypothetical protein
LVSEFAWRGLSIQHHLKNFLNLLLFFPTTTQQQHTNRRYHLEIIQDGPSPSKMLPLLQEQGALHLFFEPQKTREGKSMMVEETGQHIRTATTIADVKRQRYAGICEYFARVELKILTYLRYLAIS